MWPRMSPMCGQHGGCSNEGFSRLTVTFLTEPEALGEGGWLERAGHPIDPPSRSAGRAGVVVRPGSIEGLSPGKVLHLARAAVGWVASGSGEMLLWVRESGVWPSSEQLPLERALRLSVGETGTLEDTPAFVGGPDDREFFVSYLYLAWCFGWGVSLAAQGTRRAVYSDHEGHVWLWGEGADSGVPDWVIR